MSDHPSNLDPLLSAGIAGLEDGVMVTEAEPLDEPGPRIIYVNAAFERITGYRAADVFGRSPRFLQGRETDRRELDAVRGALEAGRPVTSELLNYRADGSPFWIELRITPIRDASGRPARFLALIRDLSASRLGERRLRDAFERMADGFSLWDAEDRLVACNSRYLEICTRFRDVLRPGVGFADALRTGLERGFYPDVDDPERFLSERLENRRGGHAAALELKTCDGVWLRVSDRPTAERGIVTILGDVTHLKERELALGRAKEAAEQANEVKSRFLANMSHELRTPLNAIIGFAEMLEGQYFGPLGEQRYVEYAGDIRMSGMHLLDLINDVLDMSKIEAGRFELHEALVDPTAIVRDCLKQLEPQIVRAELTLHIDAPDDVPLVHADPRAMRQVLLNLFANAVKFTPTRGRVSVALRETRRGLHVSVSDTGIGIDERDLPRITQPFEQIRIGRELAMQAEGHPGTGLGLALSASLVRLHGGRLRIVSRLGRGTTVTVSLPRSRLQPRAG